MSTMGKPSRAVAGRDVMHDHKVGIYRTIECSRQQNEQDVSATKTFLNSRTVYCSTVNDGLHGQKKGAQIVLLSATFDHLIEAHFVIIPACSIV